jgi:IS605 OrfB family transposase
MILKGRTIISVRIGSYQKTRIDRVIGQADPVLQNGVFYLEVMIEAPEESPYDPAGALGANLEIKNLGVDSDCEIHTGRKIQEVRDGLDSLKSRLQSCGTKSAKRHLKKPSGHMARFTKDTNHSISKSLVAKAKGTHTLIFMEDLKGIRQRATVTKAQRHSHQSRSFNPLKEFLTYKAAIAGISLVYIDPAYTSLVLQCPICHDISRSNRALPGTNLSVSAVVSLVGQVTLQRLI